MPTPNSRNAGQAPGAALPQNAIREAGMLDLHASVPGMSVYRKLVRPCLVRDAAGKLKGRGMAFAMEDLKSR